MLELECSLVISLFKLFVFMVVGRYCLLILFLFSGVEVGCHESRCKISDC